MLGQKIINTYAEEKVTSVAPNISDTSGVLVIRTKNTTTNVASDESVSTLPINSDMSGLAAWTEGSGSIGSDWIYYGDIEETSRVTDTNPFAIDSVLWKAKSRPDVADTGNGDGGFYSSYIDVDNTSKYRFSVFMKTNIADWATGGNVYLGPPSNPVSESDPTRALIDSQGDFETNAYFFATELPDAQKWYLVVGHIHPAGTATPLTKDPETQIYDMSGNVMAGTYLTDYVFSGTCTRTLMRTFQYDDPPPSSGEKETYWWHPRILILVTKITKDYFSFIINYIIFGKMNSTTIY